MHALAPDHPHDEVTEPTGPAVNVDRLPPQLRVLVRVMGEASAYELVKARGGVPLKVPAAVSADHWLMPLIGPRAFAALVAEFGGMTIELPKYDSVARQLRHQSVHALAGQLSHAQIALRTGYTKRQITNILGRERDLAWAGQADLFGGPPEDPAAAARQAAQAGAPGAHNPFGMAPSLPAKGRRRT